MKRLFLVLIACCGLAMLASSATAEAGTIKPVTTKFHVNFRGGVTGKTVYVSVAGMEPDFDIVDRVIIVTHIHHPHLHPITLILDAYLEGFQSDTQPSLPDLIHPTVVLSTTLGGFFSGEAIIVGPGNRTLFMGSMLAEALIKPACLLVAPGTKHPPSYCLTEMQHMQVYLTGVGPARGGSVLLRSWFTGNQKLQVTSGMVKGTVKLPAKARKLLARGSGSLTIHQILKDFNLPFPNQVGTNGGHPTGVQCLVGHCITASQHPTGGTGTTTLGHLGRVGGSSGFLTGVRWTTVLGFALIGLALILLIVYFWQGQKDKQRKSLPAD